MGRIIYIYILLLLLSSRINAQDPVVAQHYAAGVYLNPSIASENVSNSISLIARSFTNTHFQHNSFFQFSYVAPFNLKLKNEYEKFNHQSAFSVLCYHEETNRGGRFAKTNGLAGFSHKIQLAKAHYLNVGVQSGIGLLKINDGFEWGSQYSDVFGYQEELPSSLPDYTKTKLYPIMNAGIMWTYLNSDQQVYMRKLPFDCFLGLSASSINKPNYSLFESKEVRYETLYKLHGGMQWFLNKFISLYPNFIYAYQGSSQYLKMGAYTYFGYRETLQNKTFNFILGGWYRYVDVATIICGVVYDNLSLGVSYDFSVAGHQTVGGRGPASTEVSLKYVFKQDRTHYKRGYSYPMF